jgi:HlyD family type I secretion membrane fusion protein
MTSVSPPASGDPKARTRAIQLRLEDKRGKARDAHKKRVAGAVSRSLVAIKDYKTQVEKFRARIEQEWPRLHKALETYAAREPAEPEMTIKTCFNDIEAATLSPRKLGFAIVFAFFVVGGVWATFVPLSSAAIAMGVVSPKSSRQTVQHLEGGIIRKISVGEGDHVAAGQVLVSLEDVGAQSEVKAQTARLRNLDATESRLKAERDDLPTIEFSQELLGNLSDPEVRQIIDAQVNQFETRRSNDESKRAILAQRVAQLREQINGLTQQLDSIQHQLDLTDDELEGVRMLVDKGLERKPRLLALERSKADLLGQQGDLKARIAQSNEAIGETELEIMKAKTDRIETVDAELSQTQAQKMEVAQHLREARDRLARTQIVAPVAGVVLDLRFKTTGGVIRPGEDVVDIVPTKDSLVIDARVSTKDIDQVHAGLKARVVFPAYTQRTLPEIEGVVKQVSADALTDQRSGERYYTARVEVDRKRLHKIAPIIELQPGMTAEVFIATGERSMLRYLLQPFFNVLRRSFREA